ncbi:hypothetical protein [Clostridium fallax]|uniref:Uncharacterized protein n=1 Tax=Clostridium fallax TaxID=1533 RepID=A0A1M4UYT4_9CLOT|nr:hypothetical protein [Clostridium fallax]SHE61832.1 hypothetical protein SAMN05443638_10663 [Clostridium fallax]SQB06700.1 Uncharacterised protein [Clostridium fallax]
MNIENLKINTKRILKKIPYKKIYVVLIVFIGLNILGKIIGFNIVSTILISISLLALAITILINSILFLIDDIERIATVLIVIIWVCFTIGIIGKGMLYFIPIIFPQKSIDTIINLYSSCISAIISAFIGIMGVFLGSNQQKNYQKQIDLKNQLQKQKNLERMFKTFICQEITYNFNIAIPGIKTFFKNNEKPFNNYSYDSDRFIFKEFSEIKSEIISIDSELSKNIIEVYSMFKILQYNKKVDNLNKEQYDFVRKVYLNNIEKYEGTNE